MNKKIKEEWKTLYDFPNWQVSNFGRARKVFYPKLTINSVGYLHLHLSNKGKQRNVSIHRAVFEAFVKRIPTDKMINHKNGIKTDNNLINLELVTNRENIEHYKNNLLTYRGEKVNTAKLTENKVKDIRAKHKNGIAVSYLMKKYKVCKSTILRILNRKNWKHIL